MSITQVFVLIVVVALWVIYKINTRKEQMKGNQVNFELKLAQLENSPLYHIDYAKALVQCVMMNYMSCSLVRPSDITNHLAPIGQGVVYRQEYGILFCYRFDRSIIGVGGGEIEHSTFPIEKMVEQLNQTLGEGGRASGAGRTTILISAKTARKLVVSEMYHFKGI